MELIRFCNDQDIKNYNQDRAGDLKEYSQKLRQSLEKKYESDYASLFLPEDKQILHNVKKVILEKKALHVTMLVVIGIGGSHLGAQAVHKAVHGSLYNESSPDVKIYFVDTIDVDYLHDVITLVESALEKKVNILINVVTKSGTTTETIVNFTVFLDLLKKYHANNWQDYVVITTDQGSKLDNYAKKNNITTLHVAKKVGGRYSVLSAVGLFPLSFIDVAIEQLLVGALQMRDLCLQEAIEKNYAMQSASAIYDAYKKGKTIHDTFIFSRDLKELGSWYRQLVGESLGKKYDKDEKLVEIGITPTTSMGPEDLHSVVQLYLGGPRDKFTTFVSVKKSMAEYTVPENLELKNFVANVQNKSVPSIMNAISGGVKNAYKKDNRPFVSIELKDKTPESIGSFLQFKMLEVIYLGFLMNINPFDQPQVELYKKETREILSHE